MAPVHQLMRELSRSNVKGSCNHRENLSRGQMSGCESCVKVPFRTLQTRGMVVLGRGRTRGCGKLYKRGLSGMQKRVSPAELARVIPFETTGAPARGSESSRAIGRVHILGPMRATSYLGQDILPVGRKARAILGCLCLAGGQRLARTRLSAMLWDRVPDFQARASFRQSYRELVVAFGPLAKDLISADRETIALKTADCWIDALAVLAPDFAQGAHRGELAAYCQGEL